jgi:hypothetical protein
MKKLQNSFSTFLPQNYGDFRHGIFDLNSNAAVVAELIRICCEEDDVKAIKIAFERILGKPEKVVTIKRTLVRTLFPDASKKFDQPAVLDRVEDEMAVVSVTEDKVIVNESDAPGILLKKKLDEIGDEGRDYAYRVIDKKDRYDVAEVMAANLYAIAMRGSNLAAISLLFDYLDGAVAEVIRLDGEDTILLENYADIAPYEAKQDESGVWYVETEAVR